MDFTSKLTQAVDHLAAHDTIIAGVIAQAGLPTITPHTNYYGSLVDSIISQQLSVKAAATIERRFKSLFESVDFPMPEHIMMKDIDTLRAVGLSRAKASYVRDLAEHVLDGSLDFINFPSLSNQEIIRELTAVKGIGEWTAHMFLLFCMGRLDVLPTGDLGIKNGIQKLYGLQKQPTASAIEHIAKLNHWAPYESVASWYIWRSLDNKPAL